MEINGVHCPDGTQEHSFHTKSSVSIQAQSYSHIVDNNPLDDGDEKVNE